MAVRGELSIEEEAKALRKATTKGRRLLLFAFVGHVLILGALVGLPYLRGRVRANAGKRALASYAACLLGGEAAVRPGLSLPDDALEHYADQARLGREECQAPLEAVAPDDAFWLFPSTRYAESEVRRAVVMAVGELENTDSASVHHTPERPWLALQRVIAALTLWMEAADVHGNIFEPCVRFDAAPRSLRPERVPLQAASGAALQLRTHADGVAVLALDERGVSWVRVAAGALDPRRMRRPALVRDARFYGGVPWIIWAMSDSRCAPSCANRAMGVARLDDDVVVTPRPLYLAVHPAGSVRSSIQISEDFFWVAARRENGVGVSRFARAAIHAAQVEGALDSGEEGVSSPLLGENVAAARALRVANLVSASADGLWGIDFDGRLVDGVSDVRVEDAEWFLPAGELVFVGTPAGLVFLRGESSGTVATPPLTAPEAIFDAGRAALGGIAEGNLHIVRCRSECETLSIPDVSLFSLAYLEAGLLVAHSMGGEVHVQTWGEEGLSAPLVPAPCWSESGGLCAPMVMTSRNGRVVLGGRDERDLMVIETQDGVAWRRLVGLR